MRTQPNQPSNQDVTALTDVVAAMARVVFQSGMGAQVVDAKWDGIAGRVRWIRPRRRGRHEPAGHRRACAPIRG